LAVPFGSHAVIMSLLKAPFILLLTFPRIAYQAFRLHFHKRLDVYGKPEPVASELDTERSLGPDWNAVEMRSLDGAAAMASPEATKGGTIGWRPPSPLDFHARRLTIHFLSSSLLSHRMSQFNSTHPPDQSISSVQLISSQLGEPVETFEFGLYPNPTGRTVKIYFRSPRFFSVMLQSPSPQHTLLFGSLGERLFRTSDADGFCEVFAPFHTQPGAAPHSKNPITCCLERQLGFLRSKWATDSFEWASCRTVAAEESNHSHCLDAAGPTAALLRSLLLLASRLLTDSMERRIFLSVGARFVRGGEPWGGWDRARRASESLLGAINSTHESQDADDQLRKSPNHPEEHYDLDSVLRPIKTRETS
jgi:hypothetical protein